MKMTYTPTTKPKLNAYVDYITRDRVGENGERPKLYSSREDDVHREAATKYYKNEIRFFRVILSPERGNDMNMTEYTRDVMRRWQNAVHQKFRWYAANHYNTENAHSHVLIRGIDTKGARVQFDPRFVKQNGREFAREAATVKLGFRSRQELERDLNGQSKASRMTSLDYQLLRQTNGQSRNVVRPKTMYEERRLRYLTRIGLAHETTSPRTWKMESGWTDSLARMGQNNDRLKRMSAAVNDPQKPRMIWDSSVGKITGIVRDREYENEDKRVKYAVIETKDRVYYLYANDERWVDPKASIGDQVVVNPNKKTRSDSGTRPDDALDTSGASQDKTREHDRGR